MTNLDAAAAFVPPRAFGGEPGGDGSAWKGAGRYPGRARGAIEEPVEQGVSVQVGLGAGREAAQQDGRQPHAFHGAAHRLAFCQAVWGGSK